MTETARTVGVKIFGANPAKTYHYFAGADVEIGDCFRTECGTSMQVIAVDTRCSEAEAWLPETKCTS